MLKNVWSAHAHTFKAGRTSVQGLYICTVPTTGTAAVGFSAGFVLAQKNCTNLVL